MTGSAIRIKLVSISVSIDSPSLGTIAPPAKDRQHGGLVR